MVEFTAMMLQFEEKGEKTGWTYIEVPADAAGQLKPGSRKAFRVKGFLDQLPIRGIALVPMGDGNFILPLNKAVRRGIAKNKGAVLLVRLEADDDFEIKMPAFLAECLDDDTEARTFFYELPRSHQNYYLNWINGAKTETTQSRRAAQMLNALAKGMRFNEMMRALKKERNERL